MQGSLEPQTPNFDQTPLPENPLSKKRRLEQTDIISINEESNNPSTKEDENNNIENLSLDAYLSRFTSEDNNSFSQQMKKETELRKKKFWWMNEVTEQQKLIESSQERLAVTWPQNPATQLLTYPEMIPEKSLVTGLREVNSSATRFKLPESSSVPNNEKPKEEDGFKIISNENEYTLGARRRAEASKKVDLDNLLGDGKGADYKKLLESPKINGYGFVLDCPTPNPADITESPREPVFKVPQTPKRDQIGLDLVEKVKARQRQSSAKGLSGPGGNSNDRTPRSQRIAEIFQRTQKGIDKQLRASYNSPLIRTPNHTGPTTPSKNKNTPKQTPLHTPMASPKIPSLTDNLLDLNK